MDGDVTLAKLQSEEVAAAPTVSFNSLFFFFLPSTAEVV